MVVFAHGIVPDLKNDRAKAAPAPADCAKLHGIFTPSVHEVGLIEDLPSLLQANPVLLLDDLALPFPHNFEASAYPSCRA